MDLQIIPEPKQIKTEINPESLKDQPKEIIEYKVPKVRLSENIRNFDKKPRVFTENPYDYNSVALHKNKDNPTPSASEMIVNPIYNKAAKALGVDTVHDWNRYYDKVAKIVDWAVEETGIKDAGALAEWIYAQIKNVPAMGGKKIDDLYIYSRLNTTKNEVTQM